MSLEQPLLPAAEMNTHTSSGIDRVGLTVDDVIQNHKLFMENGQLIDPNALIAILGGADAILQHYLSSDNLTSHQLNDVNNLMHNRNTNDKSQTDPDITSILTVSSKNTLLHQIFGDIAADKLVNILYSKSIAIAAVLSVLIVLLWFLLETVYIITDKYWMQISIWCTVIYSIWILYILVCISSVNKIIIRRISQTFIYWFKICFAIKAGICDLVYTRIIYDDYPSDISGAILNLMIISFFALLDGIHMSFKTKTFVGIMTSILFLWRSFYWTFHAEPCIIDINWFNIYSSQYDMREWTASAMRVVTIFICKQTIYSIWKPSQSTLIKKSIIIEWK